MNARAITLALVGGLALTGCTEAQSRAYCTRPGTTLPHTCAALVASDPRAWGWADGMGAIRIDGTPHHLHTCTPGTVTLAPWGTSPCPLARILPA